MNLVPLNVIGNVQKFKPLNIVVMKKNLNNNYSTLREHFYLSSLGGKVLTLDEK